MRNSTALRHISLEDEWAVAHRVGIAEIALGNDVRVADVFAEAMSGECKGGLLAHDLAVVPAVEVEEFIAAVGDQRRRQLESERRCDLELGPFELGTLDDKMRGRHPTAIETMPGVVQESQALLGDVIALVLLGEMLVGNGQGAEAKPHGPQPAQFDQLFADPQCVPGLAGWRVRQRQLGSRREIALTKAGEIHATLLEHPGDQIDMRVVVLGEKQDHCETP